jgi:hypothetical protein
MTKLSTIRLLALRGVLKPIDYLKLKHSGPKTIRRNYKSKPTFQLKNHSDYDCKKWFRFTKRQIRRLACAMGVPDICRTINGVSFTGIFKMSFLKTWAKKFFKVVMGTH